MISEDFTQTWWGIASHLIHLPSYLPTFFYSIKEKHPRERRYQDAEDIKKNVSTELNAVSLKAFNDYCLQKLKIHTVKEHDFHRK
jgi:hypothetical protein